MSAVGDLYEPLVMQKNSFGHPSRFTSSIEDALIVTEKKI
jgi:hypothetical protein